MSVFTEGELQLAPKKYEYLDHTADVQLHSWGDTLKEAFEQCGIAMFGYMTELESVEITECHEIEAIADDLEGLLFHFLDELLFLFSCDPFLICSKVVITEFKTEGEQFNIKCNCYGEEFVIGKHPQGSEVKAITYSAMQIVNEPEKNRIPKNPVTRLAWLAFCNLEMRLKMMVQQYKYKYVLDTLLPQIIFILRREILDSIPSILKPPNVLVSEYGIETNVNIAHHTMDLSEPVVPTTSVQSLEEEPIEVTPKKIVTAILFHLGI